MCGNREHPRQEKVGRITWLSLLCLWAPGSPVPSLGLGGIPSIQWASLGGIREPLVQNQFDERHWPGVLVTGHI